MTTFKDLQHGTVNPFQPNTKAISYSIDKTLEQGVHKIDLITNGTYTLGLWLDNTYVGMFCNDSLTFELANDTHVDNIVLKEYNESGSIESAFIGIRHTEPVATYPARSYDVSQPLPPIKKITAFYSDESAFEAGVDGFAELQVDNAWATQSSTQYVLDVLNNYNYIPTTGRGVYADPSIELGDYFSYGDIEQLVAHIEWTFGGVATADVNAPVSNDTNLDDPYETLKQQQFKRKVSLGSNYHGVTISREKGIEMVMSPDGTENNAVGKFYADITRGMAFQYRKTPLDSWKDFLYFDVNEQVFKLSLYSTTEEVDAKIDGIEQYRSWFAYSANSNGTPMFTSPQSDTRYIGQAVAKERPTTPSSYTWALIKGADGTDGQEGKSVFIAYADNATGTVGFSITNNKKNYQGTYVGLPPQSTNPAMYAWNESPYKNAQDIYSLNFDMNAPEGKFAINAKRVDALGNDIHNAAVEINADEGVTTYGNKFQVKNGSGTETWMSVDKNGVVVTGTLLAGLIAGFTFDENSISYQGTKMVAAIPTDTFGAGFKFTTDDNSGEYVFIGGSGIVLANLIKAPTDEFGTIGDLNIEASRVTSYEVNVNGKITAPFDLNLESGNDINIKAADGYGVFSKGSLSPWSNNYYNLGSDNYRWKQLFVDTVYNGEILNIKSHKDVYILPLKSTWVDSNLNPYSSALRNLGTSSYRWNTIYLANQPNVSSDTRHKFAIQDIPEDLLIHFEEIEPKMYLQGNKWNFGYIAQDVERALYKWATNKYGLEAKHYVDKFAILHKDESLLSLLYGEISVIKDRQNSKKIKELEERLAKLEELLNKA